MGEFSYTRDCRPKEDESLKDLDDVVGSIVHDFSNVLATISSIAQISILEKDKDLVDNNLRTIHNLVMDCNYSLDRIRSSLDGDMYNPKEYCSFDQIVREAMEICRYRLEDILKDGKKDIELLESLSCKKIIYCDVHDLKHLVMNLVFNGMESIEGEGQVKIKTYYSEEEVVLEVIDNGVGIPSLCGEKLFEPYYTTKGKNGTGLGLNIVQDILFKHKGSIEVESKNGVGSKFLVKIPIR